MQVKESESATEIFAGKRALFCRASVRCVTRMVVGRVIKPPLILVFVFGGNRHGKGKLHVYFFSILRDILIFYQRFHLSAKDSYHGNPLTSVIGHKKVSVKSNFSV